MTKRRSLLIVLLGLLMAGCLSFAVACGDKTSGQSYEVTWKTDEHATIKVEGYDELPASVPENTKLVFTLTLENGYEAVVKAGRMTLELKDGKYEYTVTQKTEFTVTTSKIVSGVKVSTKPTNLLYYAGQSLDKEGMVVTIEYATGEEASTANYTVEPSVFSLGDESFTVSFGGKTSAPVALTQKVTGLVTIDPHGGKIASSYKEALEANAQIKAGSVKEDATSGVITFEFEKALTEDIALPAASDMSRGEVKGDYTFVQWDGKIPAETAVSVTATAVWNARLITLTDIHYEKGEDGKPYLVMEGTFRAATAVHLRLYEGKKQIGLEDEANGVTGKRGDTFTMKFDMTKLTALGPEYLDTWFDITFSATMDGVVDIQPISLLEYGSIVDMDERLYVDGTPYIYAFRQDSSLLKAYANYYVPVEYTIKAEDDGTAAPKLVFEGTVKDDQYNGKTAQIDFYISSSAQPRGYSVIGNNGSFKITFDLSDTEKWLLALNCYAHFSIIESETDTKLLFPASGEYNLQNADCINTDLEENGTFGALNGDSLMIHNEDWTRVFYIGKGEWGGVIGYGVNEKESLEVVGDVALKVDNFAEPTKVFYVVTLKEGGRTGFTQEQMMALHFGNIDGTSTVYPADAEKSHLVEGTEDTYELWFDITSYSGGQLWPNIYRSTGEGQYEKLLEIKDTDHSVDGLYAIVSGKKYVIHCASDAPYYDGPCVVPETPGEEDENPKYVDPNYVPPVKSATIDMETLKLELKDGKPTLTISGTATGYEASEIAFDVETHGKFHTSGGWNKTKLATTVVFDKNDETKFTATVDLSGVGLDATAVTNDTTWYGIHLNFGTTVKDIEWDKLSGKQDENGDHVVVAGEGGLHYTLAIRSATTWDRFLVVLAVSKAELPAVDTLKTLTIVSVDLEGDVAENPTKVFYVINVTTKNYTEEMLNGLKLEGLSLAKKVGSGNSWKLYFDVTACVGKMYPHLKLADGTTFDGTANGDVKVSSVADTRIIVASEEYSLTKEWDMPVLVVNDRYTVTSVTVEYTEGKAYVVISGTSQGFTQETFEAATAYFDLQNTSGWARSKDFTCTRTFTADNGNWSIRYDISSVGAGKYVCHFGRGESTNLLNATAIDDVKVSGDTLEYTVRYDTTDSEGTAENFYHAVGIIVTAKAE